MPPSPTGTITFLFSDIEGSTKLLQGLGDKYQPVLETHRNLLRAAFAKYQGHEIATEGDSFFVAFNRATDALGAAIDGQRSLLKHEWPSEAKIRVRVGLHTGEAKLVGDGYVGLAVHQASRICSVGHGGQILISGSTRELVEGHLPKAVDLRDLGEHRMKDLARPERLFQVCHPDLPVDFPKPRSLESRRHNLPVQFTTFIGREKETGEIKKLVGSSRLVTITGAGGSGKTRLALQVAADLLDDHPDGVWLVDLAAVTDPQLVLQELAATLGVREQGGGSIEVLLDDFLAEKKLLLVLDNCEHLVAACARVAAQVLKVSAASRILVTTREALGVSGEVAWRIPSMSVPETNTVHSIDEISAYEAVRLFIERALLTESSFTLTKADAPFITQICNRLDGIPLAIELAAARVNVLSPKQIVDRLDDVFRLLTGGSRSALPRQQTLRALVDWSYDLLSEPEKAMLMRASTFAGGFTLEAAEAVASGEGASNENALDILTQLVGKSLVVVDRAGEQARYRLLETIRQYGREKLFESAWAASTRDRHLDFYLSLAERTEPLLQGSEQRMWLDLLEAEHDNLRAALEWSASGDGDQAGLRLASALWRFWWVRGYWSEGRRWLDKVLSLPGEDVSSPRAKALWVAAFLAQFQDDYSAVLSLSQQSLEMIRQVGDEAHAAYPLMILGFLARDHGRPEDGRSQLEESLSIGRKFGDKQAMAWSLLGIAATFVDEGNDVQGRSSYEEALQLAREAGDKTTVSRVLNEVGGLAFRDGDFPTARSLLTEALELRRELREKQGLQWSLSHLGALSRAEGDLRAARSYFDEGLEIARGLGDRTYMSSALSLIGDLALAEGDPSSALTFLGESITIARGMANDAMLADVLNTAAWTLHINGHELQARRFAEESVTIERRLERDARLAAALHTLGAILRSEGELEQATTLYREALGCAGAEATVAAILESMAGVAGSQGRFDPAARLFGAAQAIRESKGLTLPPAERGAYDRDVSVARNGGGNDFANAWEAGRTLSLEEAVRYALELTVKTGDYNPPHST